MPYVLPNDGEVVGVGQPVAVRFDEPISDRLAAQRAIALAALRPDGLGATLAELSRQLGKTHPPSRMVVSAHQRGAARASGAGSSAPSASS